MKHFLALALSTLTSATHAFTLNNNFAASFGHNQVRVMVAGNSPCSSFNMTPEQLEALIDPAVNNFWNRVPTSGLRLIPGGFSDYVANINDGTLCSPTDDECIDEAGNTLIPAVDDIVIACNDRQSNYGTGDGSRNVLAVTIPNQFIGKKIRGAVILINSGPGALFGSLSEADKISVLAHEIGHAIGLGHAEERNIDALMYYKVVDLRRTLGQDDIDGVSYLYPIKFDGCGVLARIEDAAPPGGNLWQGILGFLMVALLSFGLKLLLPRPKARSPLGTF